MRIDPGFAARLLEGAMGKGADLAEVYLKSSRNLTAEVRGQQVDALESSLDFGYSLRVIRNRRMGFSYSRDKDDADLVIENAIEAARWTEEDNYLDLPGPVEHSALCTFDDSVAAMSGEDAVLKALAIEKAALDTDKRISKVRKAAASFSTREVLIMNSRGMEKGYSSTSCSAQITVVAEDGGDSQMGWDFDGRRFLKESAFTEVGRNAARRALQLLGARKVQGARAHVILENSVATEFLGIFASLLSSEAVQKGRSLLANRLHEEVISPLVTIADDGLSEDTLGSRPFDDEGVPSTTKCLIEKGALRGYMYNVYTAKKGGVPSTGNGVKAGISSLPAVAPLVLSLAVSPAHVHSGGLFALLDKGLYVTDAMGIHTANTVSGEFSIGVSGQWIEGGVVKHPVKEAVISGNILDFFRKVEAAGDDFRFYGNVGSPSLLIGPIDISA